MILLPDGTELPFAHASISDWTRQMVRAKPPHVRPTEPYMRLPKGAARLLRLARLHARLENAR